MSLPILMFYCINIISVIWCLYDYCDDLCKAYNAIPLTCKCIWAPACSPFEDYDGNEMIPTKEFRQAFLDAHNKYRNQFALASTDLEKNHGFNGAANMIALSYDYDLEFAATCHTRRCVFDEHCVITQMYNTGGQNLHATIQVSLDPKVISDETLKAWYEYEIIRLGYKSASQLEISYNSKDAAVNGMVRHFTQVVWAKTRAVGCWASQGTITKYVDQDKTRTQPLDDMKMLITCAYGPAGNIEGQPMYAHGVAASQCPIGQSVNSKYQGLCGMDVMPPLPSHPKIDFDDDDDDESNSSAEESTRFEIALLIVVISCRFSV